MNSKKGLSRIMSALLAASSMVGGASGSRVKNPAVNEASNSIRKKRGKGEIKNKVSVRNTAGGLGDFFKNPRNCIDTALGVGGVLGLAGTAYFWNGQRKLNASLPTLSVESAIVVGNALNRFRNWVDVVMCSGDSFLGVEIGKDNKVVVNIVNCLPNSNGPISLVKTGELEKHGVAKNYVKDYDGAMLRLGRDNLIDEQDVCGGFKVILGGKKNSFLMSVKRTDNGEFEKLDGISMMSVRFAVKGLVDSVEECFGVGVGINDFTWYNLPDIESCSLKLIEKVIKAAGRCIVASEVEKSVEASVISEESGEKIISELQNFEFIDFDFLKKCNVFDNMGVQICDARDKNNKKIALKKMRTWRQEYNKLASK